MSARILAIDFGMKRMGLAVSDALGITAQGLPTLERTRIADDLGRIRELIEEYSVERVILGNPVGHSGGPTGMSGRVAEFAEKLRRRLGCRQRRLLSVTLSRGVAAARRERASLDRSGRIGRASRYRRQQGMRRGIDLREKPDEETVRAIYQAWLDHLVIVFPSQKLSQEDLLRATGGLDRWLDGCRGYRGSGGRSDRRGRTVDRVGAGEPAVDVGGVTAEHAVGVEVPRPAGGALA